MHCLNFMLNLCRVWALKTRGNHWNPVAFQTRIASLLKMSKFYQFLCVGLTTSQCVLIRLIRALATNTVGSGLAVQHTASSHSDVVCCSTVDSILLSSSLFNLWRGDPWSAAQLHVIFQRRTVQLLLLPTRSSSLNHTLHASLFHLYIFSKFHSIIPVFFFNILFGCWCLCSVWSHASAHWLHCLRVLGTSRNIRIFDTIP